MHTILNNCRLFWVARKQLQKRSQEMHKISPKACVKSKKVHFDSARVAFQVEYDVPDDHSLRHKIPLWTEHWKRSKSSLLLHFLRQLSCQQWVRALIALTALTALSIQLFHTLDAYSKRETLLHADTRPLLSHFVSPAVSLCLPIVVPFVHKCVTNNNDTDCQNVQTIRRLFNQSLSPFSHRCKHVIDGDFRSLRACPPPRQWIRENRKCFTYFAQHSPPFPPTLHLLLQYSSPPDPQSPPPDIHVHSAHTTPDVADSEWTAVRQNRKLELKYFATQIHFLDDCDEYDDERAPPNPLSSSTQPPPPASRADCHERCLLAAMREHCPTTATTGEATDGRASHCLSRLATVRAELLSSDDKFCTIGDQNECNGRAFFARLSNRCLADCPPDCLRQTFHLTTREEMTSDATETNVTVVRRRVPDLRLVEVRRTTCLELMARVGGLCAFWAVFAWILSRFLAFMQIFVELFDIYLQKL
ncbi:unnamed protein product [Oppiella nova]|uniref:Uncharacterized protein n=1 Tax=Oppiella nova TaxID=334625 RepID=A0A7R9QK22_9ACAR|nr:unnamed protein product [Oppiella nova]CAG2167392.1 unnamed protein product [Oppiella nova]